MRSVGLPELLVILLFPVLVIPPYWRIFRRLGTSGWLSLFMVLPLISTLVLYVVAFSGRGPSQPLTSSAVAGSFCSQCGSPLGVGVRFCSKCGATQI